MFYILFTTIITRETLRTQTSVYTPDLCGGRDLCQVVLHAQEVEGGGHAAGGQQVDRHHDRRRLRREVDEPADHGQDCAGGLHCPYGHVVHKRHDVPLPPAVSTINFQLHFHCLPHFYELLLVVAGGLVVLPELVDVDVADRDDQNVAAVDHQKEYSNEKNVAKGHDDIPTAKDRSMGGW